MTTDNPHPDRTTVCPGCDTPSVTQAVRLDGWRCNKCPWRGPAPATRPKRNDGRESRSGLAKVLVDMDPDDVGGEV